MIEQKLDTYLDLCTQVYEISKPRPEAGAYAFYRSYVIDAKGPILEPMCGTGRFLLPLLADGFTVQGFDASEHMLKALHAKAKLQGLNPIVWKDFIENLDRSEKYSLIFIPAGSFGLITDPTAIKTSLKTLYEHLAEDGILLLEGETLKSAPQNGIWRGSNWLRADGKMILLSICATLEGMICTSIGKYELVDQNSIIHTEIETYKIRLYEPEELTVLLQEAGFNAVKRIKAFDRNSNPADNDKVIVYECKK